MTIYAIKKITKEEQNPYAYEVLKYMDIGVSVFGSSRDFYKALCKKYNAEIDDTSVYFDVLGRFIYECELYLQLDEEAHPYEFARDYIEKLHKEFGLKEEICPKCKGQLEFDSGAFTEWEKWYCKGCGSLFEVDVQIIRFWDTLEEVEVL